MENLCSRTQSGGFEFLPILDLWGISFYAVVVFGLGMSLLFKSALGHCDTAYKETEWFQIKMKFLLCMIFLWNKAVDL